MKLHTSCVTFADDHSLKWFIQTEFHKDHFVSVSAVSGVCVCVSELLVLVFVQAITSCEPIERLRLVSHVAL